MMSRRASSATCVFSILMDLSFDFIFGLSLLERSPPRHFPLDRFHFVQRFVRWHGNVNRLAPPHLEPV